MITTKDDICRYYISPITLLSATSHPFNAMMWIENEDGAATTFRLRVVYLPNQSCSLFHKYLLSKVHGYHDVDGSGTTQTRSGSMNLGNLRLQFHSFCIYGTNDPSITNVFYYVSNEEVSIANISQQLRQIEYHFRNGVRWPHPFDTAVGIQIPTITIMKYGLTVIRDLYWWDTCCYRSKFALPCRYNFWTLMLTNYCSM